MNLKELPFVFLVLADLSGHPTASKRFAERKALQIDRDNFDSVMERAAPRLMFRVPRREGVPGSDPDLEVTLAFRSMKDFRPESVAGQIPALKALRNKKEAVAALSAQLADVLMHPEFRRLEGTWRGLSYLVHQTETSETIKIRVLNATKADRRRPGECGLLGPDNPVPENVRRRVRDGRRLSLRVGHRGL